MVVASPSARFTKRTLPAVAIAGCIAGLVIGAYHLLVDPLADAHAYFDAATRLNMGLPLYPLGADPNSANFYRYPPLLAVSLRPIVALGWTAFAFVWEGIVVASFVVLLWRFRAARWTWPALGLLAMPTAWCIAIGQAQVPTTLLLTIAAPWSVALATNLKLFPGLVALWWIGRRDWRSVARFGFWMLALGVGQVVLEPGGSAAFPATLSFDQVGQVVNLSPYALSPALWVVLVPVGIAGALVLARTSYGWPAAVAVSTLVTPRLTTYLLMNFLAAVRTPPFGSARTREEIREAAPEGNPGASAHTLGDV